MIAIREALLSQKQVMWLRRKWSTRQLGMSDGLERAGRVMKELIKKLKQMD